MGCKRVSGAERCGIAKTRVSRRFPLVRGIRFTLPFRETITIGADSCPGCCAARLRCAADPGAHACAMDVGPGSAEQRQARCTASGTRPSRVASRLQSRISEATIKGLCGIQSARPPRGHGERGRRRTRQDQISLRQRSPVKLRTSRSAPNEENLFLLPDRFSRANPSKMRSSRLT
jgi:hypothetical protein